MSADIIPFPPRQPRQVPESDNRARLRTALARLDEANRRQKDAVASWRKALADLRTSMQQLDNSMKMFEGGEVATMLLVFIALVALADRTSAWLRKALG